MNSDQPEAQDLSAESATESGSESAESTTLLADCTGAFYQYPLTALKLLITPGRFFASIAGDDHHEKRLAQSTVFLATTAVISALAYGADTYHCPLSECLDKLILQAFNIIGLNYAFAVVMHVILMVFGNRGAFLKSVESANYCTAHYLIIAAGNLTKALLSALVPYTSESDSFTQWFVYACLSPTISYTSILVPLYGCYIFFRGIKATGKISGVKSSLAIFVPVILFFLPAIIGAAIVAIAMGMMTRHQ